MTDERRAVIDYRLASAREALEEAEVLFKDGHVNAYVSRLYYACYHAVSALLFTKGMSTSKHSQLRALLHRDFVKTGVVPRDMGRHFDRLFESRQEADYGDFADFKAEEVAGWLEETRSFVANIESIIQRETGA